MSVGVYVSVLVCVSVCVYVCAFVPLGQVSSRAGSFFVIFDVGRLVAQTALL